MSDQKLYCCVCSGQRERAGVPLKQVHAVGRCITCYQYRREHGGIQRGYDRPERVVDNEIRREKPWATPTV